MQHMKVLRYVELAARLGSIRKAADQLNIASTAVNRSILALERELGAPLFERLARGVRLTAAGELFVAHIRTSTADLERARSEIEALGGLRRGMVRLAVSEAVIGSLLPETIARFQARYPRIQFEVAVAGNEAIVTAVVEDAVDLGLVFNPALHPDFVELAGVEQRLNAVMAADHPLAGSAELRLHQCLAYPLALAGPGTGGRAILDRLLAQARLRVAPSVVSGSFEFMETYCAQGQGIYFQIAAGTLRPVQGGRLVAIPVAERAAGGRLVLGVRRGRAPTVQAATFIEALKPALAALGPAGE